MSTSTRTKKSKAAASLVWFEIPAENLERARGFYAGLFGWKINPFPAMKDYWHIDTGGSDASPDGALMARMCPECHTQFRERMAHNFIQTMIANAILRTMEVWPIADAPTA